MPLCCSLFRSASVEGRPPGFFLLYGFSYVPQLFVYVLTTAASQSAARVASGVPGRPYPASSVADAITL